MRKRKKEEACRNVEKFPKIAKSDTKNGKDVEGDAKEFVKSVKVLLRTSQTRVSGLTKLRDVLRELENPKSADVFKEFIQQDSAFQEIFTILEKGRNAHSQLEFQMALDVLECILMFTAENGEHSSAKGMEIVWHILHNHLKTFYSCLNPASPASITKAVLRVLAAMVTQGSAAAREVQGMFDFSLKALSTLANRHDNKANQDVRTCFIHFCLSFLVFGDVPTIKHILELKGFLGSVVLGLSLDSPDIVLLVLNTLQGRVVNNASILKKTKVQFFNAFVLSQLVKLYHYTKDIEGHAERDAETPSVRQTVHKFLLGICCSFKFGICFSNKTGGLASRTNNPVLLRFLQSLPKVTEDPLLQELVIKVLNCCQDLLYPYLSNLSAMYEPRLSMPWLMNVNLLMKIYSSLPSPSQMMRKSGLKPAANLVPSLVNMVIPPGLTRSALSHGIQHSSQLVKHTTLKLLALVLERAQDVMQNCNHQSSDSSKADTSLVQLFSEAVFKMVPDVKTLISLRQNLVAEKKLESEREECHSGDGNAEGKPSVLLLAQVLHVTSIYQRLWPTVLSQAGFDLGKLVSWQQDMNDISLPPIVQHLTLQILLQSPPGAIKWHHQKSKAGPTVMHSILNLFTNAPLESISCAARDLVLKLLSETGLFEKDTGEVDIWLQHLDAASSDKSSTDYLVEFLHEAFSAVASEPYSYTDTVMELMSEVMDKRASQKVTSIMVSAADGGNSSSRNRFPFSPLVVRVLMQYSELVCKNIAVEKSSPDLHLSCLAEYVNMVLVDILHSQSDPSALCLAVERFLGNMSIPDNCHVLRSTHQALLNHVLWWSDLRDVKQLGLRDEHHDVSVVKEFLDTWRKSQDHDQTGLAGDFLRLLAPLNQTQWLQIAPLCINFCISTLNGDFSPIVHHLQVKLYKLVGCSASEDLLPLFRALPFSVLLWQILGDRDSGDLDEHGQVGEDAKISYPCQDSEVHALLLNSLEQERPSMSIQHSSHVLLYLKKFVGDFLRGERTHEQKLKSAVALCFQVLSWLISRVLSSSANTKEQTANIEENSHEINAEVSGKLASMSRHSARLPDSTDLIRNIFKDALLLELFLWSQDTEMSDSNLVFLSCEFTFHISNLLWILLQSRSSPEVTELTRPFLHKICQTALREVEQASSQEFLPEETATSCHALFLLSIFHPYCNKQDLNKLITVLLKLPRNMLLKPALNSQKPVATPLLETLYTLLEPNVTGGSRAEIDDSVPRQGSQVLLRKVASRVPCSSEFSPGVTLPIESFHDLLSLLQNSCCVELDAAVCSMLKNSWQYVLACPSSLLDCCLDNPNDARVAIAATLISSSATMRAHLESRCLVAMRESSRNLDEERDSSVKALDFKDHLQEFVPVVEAYLESVEQPEISTAADQLGATDMLSLLYDTYQQLLWKCLFSCDSFPAAVQETNCRVLRRFIILCNTDVAELQSKFESLVRLTDFKAWNRHQLSTANELCGVLGTRSPDNKHTVRTQFAFACMTSFSRVSCVSDDSSDQYTDLTCKAEELVEWISSNVQFIGKNIPSEFVSVWNKFLKDALRYNMDCVKTLHTLSQLIKSLYAAQQDAGRHENSLLPLGTVWELITSHSHFLPVMLGGEQADGKEALVELMLTVAELDPTFCQASHLPVLFGAYSASLTVTDQSLLQLLLVYERSHVSLKECRPYLWGQSAIDSHRRRKGQGVSLWMEPNITEVLEQLDVGRMIRSAVKFPLTRTLKLGVQQDLCCMQDPSDSYDPCFLLPLFSYLLTPSSVVDCRKFVERGCVGYTVASLSSRDDHVRQAGYHVLTRYLTHLEGAWFREKKQILHLLNCLKNGITELNARVPCVITCFVMRAAQILLQPEHFLYVLVNSYLLQRPALDLREVPLFYTLFNSSSMQHRKERGWMLQLLVEGMRDSPDYYMYKRRHVMELALSYHDSQLSDQNSQAQVIHLLTAALSIHAAAFDLARNYGIVAWIHSLCNESLRLGVGRVLGPSLQLLRTLWFTLQRGKPNSRAHDASDIGDLLTLEEKRETPLPPTLREECALVCWTFLQQLRANMSDSSPHNVSAYIELLYSVVAHLTNSGQYSGLTHERMLSLISLWSEAFCETELYNELLTELKLDSRHVINLDQTPDHVSDEEAKKNSSAFLLGLIELWSRDVPITSTSLPAGVLTSRDVMVLAWHLGIRLLVTSGFFTSETSVLLCVEIFRKRLESDARLQKLLVDSPGAENVRMIMNFRLQNKSFSRLEKSEHTAQHRNDQEQRILERKLKCVEKKEKSVKNELYKIRREKYSQRFYSSQAPVLIQLEAALPCTKLVSRASEDPCDFNQERCTSSRALSRSSTVGARYSKRRTSADEFARVRLANANASAGYCSELARRRKSQEMESSEFESFKRELRRKQSAGIINSVRFGEERLDSKEEKWDAGIACSVRKAKKSAGEKQTLTVLSARVEETSPEKDAQIPISSASCFSSAGISFRRVRSVDGAFHKAEPLENSRQLLSRNKASHQRSRQKPAGVAHSRKVRFSLVKQKDAEAKQMRVVTTEQTGPEAKTRETTPTSAEARIKIAAVKVNDKTVAPVPVGRDKPRTEYYRFELLSPAHAKSDLRAKPWNRRSSWAAGTGTRLKQVQVTPSEVCEKLSSRRKSVPVRSETWSLTNNEEKIACQAIMRQKEIEMATDNVKKLSLQCFNAAAASACPRGGKDSSWMSHNQDGSWVIPLTKKINRPRAVRRHTEGSVLCTAELKRLLSGRRKFDIPDSSARERSAIMRREVQSEQALDDLCQGIAQCRYLRCR